MAKGAESKAKFISEILKTFEGSFLYNGGKEIRVPMQEDGNDIQLKITGADSFGKYTYYVCPNCYKTHFK